MKKLITTLLCTFALAGSAAVFTSGCTATETRRSTGETVDDTAITAKVKSALFGDKAVSGFDVKVDTFRGVVSLSGFVDSEEQKAQAETVARGVANVVNVINNLTVKTSVNR